jgi:hypothetical protein
MQRYIVLLARAVAKRGESLESIQVIPLNPGRESTPGPEPSITTEVCRGLPPDTRSHAARSPTAADSPRCAMS